MEMFQLENLYKANGITNYKLRNCDDLYKVHRVNYKSVNGYNSLNDLNKDLFKKAIVNIFNGLGLESRATMIPKGIY